MHRQLFFNGTPMPQEIRAGNGKWNFIKLKASVHQVKQILLLQYNSQNKRKFLASIYL
jgi:hypothetical protein